MVHVCSTYRQLLIPILHSLYLHGYKIPLWNVMKSSLRPLTSGKCPCKYLIVSELLPTPPLPTTQTVSRLLDSTVCPLCAYSAIYTVPLVPKCSSRWVRIVSVGAGGPGQHAYGGRCHKLSRKILALRESLYLARSRSISDTAQRKWVRQGAYAQFQPHPRWEFNFCCSAKEISQIYYMHGYKFSGGNTGIYSRIWPGNNAVITSLPSKRFICTHHTWPWGNQCIP